MILKILRRVPPHFPFLLHNVYISIYIRRLDHSFGYLRINNNITKTGPGEFIILIVDAKYNIIYTYINMLSEVIWLDPPNSRGARGFPFDVPTVYITSGPSATVVSLWTRFYTLRGRHTRHRHPFISRPSACTILLIPSAVQLVQLELCIARRHGVPVSLRTTRGRGHVAVFRHCLPSVLEMPDI